MKLTLAKLHATGNDFLVRQVDDPDAARLDPAIVTVLCDRHAGIGADGLITIGPGTSGADCTMTLQNADGGEAEISGNGARCLAFVAARLGLARGDELVVDTAGGRRTIAMARDDAGTVVAAEVDMGAVTFGAADVVVTVHGVQYCGDVASIGNPHFVCFVDDLDAVRVTTHGPIIERNERFPHRTNVEFVRVDGPDALTMRVWERGAGETLSCGSGACAAAAVAHRRGLVNDRVCVGVPGGALDVVLGDTVRLGGPVVHVFDMHAEVS
jgi:diaminopimelate epimerase